MAKESGTEKINTVFDFTSYEHLLELLNNIGDTIGMLYKEFTKWSDWHAILLVAGELKSWIRALKEAWPDDADNSSLVRLEQAGIFLERYAEQKNARMVKSNAASLKANHMKVREEVLRKGRSCGYSDLLGSLTEIEDGPSRNYIEEACRSGSVGASRAAIVMAGCALEAEVRRIFESSFGKPSGKMQFASVIESLDKKGNLTPNQEAIVSICRTFRNLMAHPSDFQTSEKEAKSIIQLAFEQLRKRKI